MPFDANKLYCSEILAILLQNNDSKCVFVKCSCSVLKCSFQHSFLLRLHYSCLSEFLNVLKIQYIVLLFFVFFKPLSL